jgi:colanic acid biosynthesis glycosyl transferase WcaI
VNRGHQVTVITAINGYDDPSQSYSRKETVHGVRIVRLPWSSFGKRSVGVRVLGSLLFGVQATIRGLLVRRIDAVLGTTSPPLAPLAAIAISLIRRKPLKYWVMDLNPDQAVALGLVGKDSAIARLLSWMNRAALKRASDVVVLDHHMAERVNRKLNVSPKLHVIPPWAHVQLSEPIDHAQNRFRAEHGLEGKFVVMYSGNHGITTPLRTILEAAVRLRNHPRLQFLFVGGGLGKKDVDAVASGNIQSLPYQPAEGLEHSLSAADVHLVSIGNEFVGIIHPCKIYGALAVGRPVIVLGPAAHHARSLMDTAHVGWQVDHGDVDGMVALLERLAEEPPSHMTHIGRTARSLTEGALSKKAICGRVAAVIERKL